MVFHFRPTKQEDISHTENHTQNMLPLMEIIIIIMKVLQSPNTNWAKIKRGFIWFHCCLDWKSPYESSSPYESICKEKRGKKEKRW